MLSIFNVSGYELPTKIHLSTEPSHKTFWKFPLRVPEHFLKPFFCAKSSSDEVWKLQQSVWVNETFQIGEVSGGVWWSFSRNTETVGEDKLHYHPRRTRHPHHFFSDRQTVFCRGKLFFLRKIERESNITLAARIGPTCGAWVVGPPCFNKILLAFSKNIDWHEFKWHCQEIILKKNHLRESKFKWTNQRVSFRRLEGREHNSYCAHACVPGNSRQN